MTNIGIVLFSMTPDSLGGVRNYVYNLGKGFEKIGVNYDIICVYKRRNKRNISKWIDVLLREPLIIQWSSKDDIKELNNYDFLITKHIGPHGTEKNPPASGWESIFTDTKPEKYPAIGDPYWRKYYPWGIKVKDYISGIIVEHEPALRSLVTYPCEKALIRLPYDFNYKNLKFNNKERIIVSFTHWKPWKNHKYLLEALAKYNKKIFSVIKEVRLFSDGIERRKMSSPHKHIREMYDYGDIWFDAEKYFYYGNFVSEDIKQKELEKAMFTIDLSWSKTWNNNITYTCFESYENGCIMIGSSEHYRFPKEAFIDCGYPRNSANIANAIYKTKDIDEKTYNNMIKAGVEFILKEHSAEKIARQVMYYMENKDTDGSFKIYRNATLFNLKR